VLVHVTPAIHLAHNSSHFVTLLTRNATLRPTFQEMALVRRRFLAFPLDVQSSPATFRLVIVRLMPGLPLMMPLDRSWVNGVLFEESSPIFLYLFVRDAWRWWTVWVTRMATDGYKLLTIKTVSITPTLVRDRDIKSVSYDPNKLLPKSRTKQRKYVDVASLYFLFRSIRLSL